MNVPVQARIDQIRVNLERTRWVLPGLQERFVIVNIAGFRTYLMEERTKEVWSTRSIVGKPFHKSPVFADSIRFLVINPTWTVPAGILGRSILPKARKDPSYLTSNNFWVVAGDGKRIDPSTVNWSTLSVKGFPYRIVQAPGPNNALGQIKFMFLRELIKARSARADVSIRGHIHPPSATGIGSAAGALISSRANTKAR